MNHAEHSTHDTLTRQHRKLTPTTTTPPTAASPRAIPLHHDTQPRQNLRATPQHPRTRAQRIHDQQRTHPRLLIQEREQNTQTGTGLLPPTPHLPLIRAPHKIFHSQQRILERRQETILAIAEHVIERAPRHPRTTSHPRHAHTPIPKLRDNLHSGAQHPRTLHLRNLNTTTPHRHRPAHHAHPPTRGIPATPPGARETDTQWACRPYVSVKARLRSRVTPRGWRSSPRARQAVALPLEGGVSRVDPAARAGALLGQEREREREMCQRC